VYDEAVCGFEKEMSPEGWINIIKIDFSLKKKKKKKKKKN